MTLLNASRAGIHADLAIFLSFFLREYTETAHVVREDAIYEDFNGHVQIYGNVAGTWGAEGKRQVQRREGLGQGKLLSCNIQPLTRAGWPDWSIKSPEFSTA